MRPIAIVPAVLFVGGAVLIGLAVASGGASFGLLLIVPFVIGRSLDLAIGVLLLVAGFLTLPLALRDGFEVDSPPGPSSAGGPGGSGGVVIVGPVPIVFGSWKRLSRRARLLLWIGAAAAFVLLVVVAVLLAR